MAAELDGQAADDDRHADGRAAAPPRCSRRRRGRAGAAGARARTWGRSLLRSFGRRRRRSWPSRAPRASPTRVEPGDQPAAQHDVERVGHADQLLEVGRDQQHGQARRRGRCAAAPRSRPGRRRRRRGSGARRSARCGSPLISRPTISFCWLPPDSDAAGDVDAGRADVVLARRCAGCRRARPGGRSRSPCTLGGSVWWPRMRFSHSGASQQQPLPVPVLGDVADAGLAAAPGGPVGDVVLAAGVTRAGAERPQAHDAPRPARPGRCPRRRRCRRPRRVWIVEGRRRRAARGRRRPARRSRPSHLRAAPSSVTVDSRGLGRGQLAADHQLGQLARR